MINNSLKSILEDDPIKNIATIGFFSNYPVESYFIENNSVLIFGKSDHLWAHIVSSSETELQNLLEKHQSKTKYFFSVEDWMIPLILKYGAEDWIMATNRYILELNANTKSPLTKTVRINKLHAQFILENSDYKDYLSIEYIMDRLDKDISAGIIINGKLVAWGFTHDDGALGFLHVLDEYRKKGYGMDILLALIQMRKEEKKPIFGNIVPTNVASVNLVSKLGFVLDSKTSWIKLK